MSGKQNYHIVIPARYASQRLPGKMLLDLAGKPLLQHVWERAGDSNAEAVVIATDDERIYFAAESFGAEVVMTLASHQSGSDRIAECARQCGWPSDQLIVNLQGDEPMMPAACMDQVAELLAANPDCEVASLYWPISSVEELASPNAVKVVTDLNERALYFSRYPVPFARDCDNLEAAMSGAYQWKRHLGLYAYRLSALERFTAGEPTPLEQTERLEQLRFMEQGAGICMAQARQFIPAGVDTREDLERIRKSIV